ncbi:MAG: hypothetical protein AAFY03_02755 [Pseudomonadota bacterium]
MRPEQVAMAVFVAVILAVSLWTVGSPGYARKKQQDLNTTREMTSIASTIQRCALKDDVPREGDIEDLNALCSDNGPVTANFRYVQDGGVAPLPIRYVSKDGRLMRLCANLHFPAEAVEHVSRQWFLDPDTGCLELNRPG